MSDLPPRGRGARPPGAVPRSCRGGDSGSAPPAIPPSVAGSSSFGGDASPISPDPTSTRATYSTVVPARSRHTAPLPVVPSPLSADESDSGTAHPQEMEVEGTQGGEEVSRDPSVDLLLGPPAARGPLDEGVAGIGAPPDVLMQALDDLGRPASPPHIPASRKRPPRVTPVSRYASAAGSGAIPPSPARRNNSPALSGNAKAKPPVPPTPRDQPCPHKGRCVNCHKDHAANSASCKFWAHRYDREWIMAEYRQ
ncbi:unnamed protein product [Cyclocybe aegerita]|uniref:Uncharacterized protein n=1 Tax=Cyclocybe aegerita TaxID=1973307 RepID=A0A8S0W0S4_CYCAE|nr:unnamed protein product [Cyclocybe aegerita]